MVHEINVIFQGSQNDTTQLHTAIDRRVIALKRNQSETVSDGAASYNCNLGDEQGANVFPVTAPEGNIENITLAIRTYYYSFLFNNFFIHKCSSSAVKHLNYNYR